MPVTVFRGADIFTADAADRVIEGGWLAVADGRIAGLGPRGTYRGGGTEDDVIDLDGHAILPGLVNAHAHSPMVLFRGRAERDSLLTMDGWRRVIREPELHMREDDVQAGAALAYAEMAATGTTLAGDQYFFADAVLAAAAESGLRAVIAYGIVELGDQARGRQELERALRFVDGAPAHGNDRIHGWIGPHAPYVDNSEELLIAEARAAKERGIGLHLHMAVGPEDNAPTMAAAGVSAAVALEKIGFFQARVLAAHCLELTEADIAVFANAAAATVVHCPTAGLRSGRPGITPVAALHHAGANVALGTDNMAANNSHDLFAEMKIAGLAAAHREGRAGALSATVILRMATIDGARALGLGETTGSLEEGKAADLIAVDLRGAGYSPAPDLASLLVYSGSGRDVRHVLVGGEWIVRDGQMVRIDLREIKKAYERVYWSFWDRVDGRVVSRES